MSRSYKHRRGKVVHFKEQNSKFGKRQACNLRNTIRFNARRYMSAANWSYYLFANEDNRPFEFFVKNILHFMREMICGISLLRKLHHLAMQ